MLEWEALILNDIFFNLATLYWDISETCSSIFKNHAILKMSLVLN